MRSNNSDKKRLKGDDKGSTNRWMATFSDLCTLLLTFFVLLFSMSSMDDQKLKVAFQNFGGSSGLLSFREYRQISRPLDILIKGLHKSLGQKVVMGKHADFQKSDIDSRELETLGGSLIIQQNTDGIELSFGESILFPAGGAEISEELIPVLDKIARFISITGYQAYTVGHSDNIPPQNDKYLSNVELSIARASNVRNYLLQLEDISPDSIALTGYGAMKPIASNELPEGRKMNRRVEIVLKSQRYY